MKKRGLGKGLEALLGDELDVVENKAKVSMVKVVELSPNPHQPRRDFDEKALQDLADSVVQHGIIQPIAVRSVDNGFEIIAGERRFRAAQMVGLDEVPVVVHEVSDEDSAALALIENLQREDINVIDKGLAIKKLIENFSFTHEQCAKVIGQSRSSVSNTLRLLELSEGVQLSLISKQIDMGHARALLAVDRAAQYDLLDKIVLNGLSVRETEALVKATNNPYIKTTRNKQSEQTKMLEKNLQQYFNSKVNVRKKIDGTGKITISFNDNEDMTAILGKMGLETIGESG